MSTIKVSTQAELDAAREKYKNSWAVTIQITSPQNEQDEWIKITSRPDYPELQMPIEVVGSAKVEVYGSPLVRARESAKIKAFESAMVEAFDDADVEVYDTAKVTAFRSATVKAFDSATVDAYDKTTVVAHDKAKVGAFGSATVERLATPYKFDSGSEPEDSGPSLI